MSFRLTTTIILSVAFGSSAPAAFTWSEPGRQFGLIESTASSPSPVRAELASVAWTSAACQPPTSERVATLGDSVDVLTQLGAGSAPGVPVPSTHAERTELLAIVTDASAEASRLVMLPSGPSATLTQPVGASR